MFRRISITIFASLIIALPLLAQSAPDARALKPILSPTYIKTFPEKDGWGTPYRYAVSSDGAHYRLASAGADRQFEAGSDTIALFDEKNRPPAIRSAIADGDIIYQDGNFVQLPAAAAAKMDSNQ